MDLGGIAAVENHVACPETSEAMRSATIRVKDKVTGGWRDARCGILVETISGVSEDTDGYITHVLEGCGN